MFVTVFGALTLFSAIWIYTKWRRVRQYWSDRRVPHLPPHPLLGSLTFLMKQNPAVWMREMKKHFASPYIGIWLFWRPGLIINCPKIARRVLVTDSEYFRNRNLGSGKADPVGSLTMFTVNDPIWTAVRKRLTLVFTSAKLRTFQNLMSVKSKELIQRIKNEVDKGIVIDLRSVFSDYTTDVISIAAFGVDGEATLTGRSAMRTVTKEFMEYSFYRSISWCFIFFLPKASDIFRFFPRNITDCFRKIFSSVVAQRGGYGRKVEHVKDLLDALVKMKQDAYVEGEEMSEDLLVAQAAIFLQGGFDTTAVILTFAVYELAFAPEIQKKLYEELFEAEQSTVNGYFEAENLAKLTYLNCVIKETLRKYPSMGWLDRIADKEFELHDDLTIETGTTVYVNAYGMHYDDEIYPDPDKFDPDRFLPENDANLKAFTYLPFGEGPRHCIGNRFAEQNLRYGLSSIVLNFQLNPPLDPTSPPPANCKISEKGMFLAPDCPLSVVFAPREEHFVKYKSYRGK